MECPTAQSYLPEFARGFLGEEENQEVMRHLERCPDCRREFADIRQTLEEFDRAGYAVHIPADEYGDSIWDSLYEKIRNKNLHTKPQGIGGKIGDAIMNWRPGILQVVNIALIISVGAWFYISYSTDSTEGDRGLVQTMIGKASPDAPKRAAEQLVQKKNALFIAVARVASNPDLPLEKIQEILTQEREDELYDSVTDFIADMVIRLSEKS